MHTCRRVLNILQSKDHELAWRNSSSLSGVGGKLNVLMKSDNVGEAQSLSTQRNKMHTMETSLGTFIKQQK